MQNEWRMPSPKHPEAEKPSLDYELLNDYRAKQQAVASTRHKERPSVQHKKRLKFSQDYLGYVRDLEKEDAADIRTLKVLESQVLRDIAEEWRYQGDWEQTESHLSESLSAASASGDEEAIFHALQSLGYFYHQQERKAEAELHYQRSLVYGAAGWPYNLVTVLRRLAALYSDSEDSGKLYQAVGLYDWLIALDPDNMEAVIYRFSCLARIDSETTQATVDHYVRLREYRDLREVAFCVAANLAVGRKAQARRLAKKGLSMEGLPGSKEIREFLEAG